MAPALGLTQIQSSPGGGASVPLVSTAISKPAAWRASTARVELQQRLPAGADHEAAALRLGRPGRGDGSASSSARGEPPAAGSVGAHEVGVAEPADGGARSSSRPVQRLHPANRQKTAGRPVVRALALQRVEDLLDRVAHTPRADIRTGSGQRRFVRSPSAQQAGVAGAAGAAPAAGVVAARRQAVIHARGRAPRMISALLSWISGAWMGSGRRPSTPARVARFAIRSNASMNSGRQSG